MGRLWVVGRIQLGEHRLRGQAAIVRRLVDVLRTNGHNPITRAVSARLGTILKDIEDVHEVELVCLHLANGAKGGYVTSRVFSWQSYEAMRMDLRIPSGAWKYALWGYKSSNAAVVRSIDHWLGIWKDGKKAGVDIEVHLAQTMLQRLATYAEGEEVEV